MQNPVRRILVAATALLTLSAMLTACSGSPEAATRTVTATATKTVEVAVPAGTETTAKPPAPVTSDYGVKLVSGDDSEYGGRTYACKQGFESLQVPVGQTTQSDGTKVSLSTVRGDNYSQTLEIKVAGNASVPSIIVNPVAHGNRSDLYNQTALKVNIKANGTGKYTLVSSAFADNYVEDGIADVTLCIVH